MEPLSPAKLLSNNPLYDVHLVVRLGTDNPPKRGYFRAIRLPFIPVVGMKFEQGVSCKLWETQNGELNPGIEHVIYDVDEEIIVCLLSVSEELSSSFWVQLCNPTKDGHKCGPLDYFRHY